MGAKIGSGLVTVRISDRLPVFAFVGGKREMVRTGGSSGGRRLVKHIEKRRFAVRLEAWSFDKEQALGTDGNIARFWNTFRDMYDEEFPWVESKKKKRDVVG